MSVRALLAAVAVAALTVFVAGCAQTSSPTSPSSSTSSLVGSQPLASSSFGGVTIGALSNGPPITPIWAQLNRVTSFLVSANHELDLYLNVIPGNPVVPGNPVFPAARNSLNFYLKANGVLDQVAVNGPPITPQTTDALNAILGEAKTTLFRLTPCEGCAPLPPSLLYGEITAQAEHTIRVTNGILNF